MTCRTALLALIGSAIVSLLPGTVLAFQMSRLDGERVDLETRVGGGQWTLVQFWTLDCLPCEQQKPMLDAFHRAHHDTDARVIGVALDGVENSEAIKTRIALGATSFEHLLAYSDVFARQFREATGEAFRATPTYWLFDPAGEPAGVHVGPLAREDLERVVAAER